ncbi:MarR family winged helix-turn-helix transcriptional regulator [Microbacterium sp. G2-8]|uniref:MarR family winged helix-turn-helix transcriptional regulator n=1 Tax=Microbacterium sp. G2-8 TaxID=2842454 RepID=UPI001C895BF1|nr:MarR family transcriptional regulator [Microbacterium sp. G2-8]
MSTEHDQLLHLGQTPSWLLSQARMRSHRILTERLAAIAARRYHLRVLSVLVEHGPLPQVAIGTLADLDRADLSVSVDELEAEGTVIREQDPEDGRRKIVRITDDGQARARQLGLVLREVQDELFAPLEADEREAFIATLRKLQP